MHPMFERVPDFELVDDPCIAAMREETDEAIKVIRNNGSIWHAVYRKKDMNDTKEKAEAEKDVLAYFLWFSEL